VISQAPSLTILGSSCSIPRPGRACSSYLLEANGQRIVLDLGSGAFANLRQHIIPDTLDAIVISHMHTDHFLDLIPLRYALRYGERTRRNRLALYLPPGGMTMLEQLGQTLSRESGDFFHDVYDMQEYDTRRELSLAGGTMHFALTTHYIDAYAMRYDVAGSSIVYSSDTAYNEGVAELADRADLFLCEATLGASGCETGEVHGHISAEAAGRLAQLAGTKQLMLTHYGAECDTQELKSAARSTYQGEVLIADDHLQMAIGVHAKVAVG
jgi:ribonuclease BN (tRNA processing enzyme)